MNDQDSASQDNASRRTREILIELWAQDLFRTLQNAINGKAHWRNEAQTLLNKIEHGILPDQDLKP